MKVIKVVGRFSRLCEQAKAFQSDTPDPAQIGELYELEGNKKRRIPLTFALLYLGLGEK